MPTWQSPKSAAGSGIADEKIRLHDKINELRHEQSDLSTQFFRSLSDMPRDRLFRIERFNVPVSGTRVGSIVLLDVGDLPQ